MTQKRILFGDVPAADGSARAPIPMVTQAMAAVAAPDEAAAAAAALAARLAAANAGIGQGPGGPTPHTVIAAVAPHGAAAGATLAMHAQPPAARGGSAAAHSPGLVAGAQLHGHGSVEIGLTQHTLPTDGVDGRLYLHHAPDSPRAAAFRVLRHHMLDAGRQQVIVVTSPRDGDGKTTAAANLALALAECGRAKVLLIDANLKRPQLATMLRFVPPWCFVEQLAAHRHQPLLPWSLIEIPQLWLQVAGIGPTPTETALVDAPAFAIALERLRLGGYDHIIIDGPSVLGSAEMNLIQDSADAVLFAFRAGKTSARDIRQALEQLSPAKVMGSVLLE